VNGCNFGGARARGGGQTSSSIHSRRVKEGSFRKALQQVHLVGRIWIGGERIGPKWYSGRTKEVKNVKN